MNELITSIEDLVLPLEERVPSIEDVLNKKIANVDGRDLDNLKDIDDILQANFPSNAYDTTASWIRYLRILIDKLLDLKKKVENDDNHMFSLNQNILLKKVIEIVVCLGVIQHLEKGIGTPINDRLPTKGFSDHKLPPSEKKYILNFTLLSLYELCKLDTFNTIIKSKHLGDVIAGTAQVILNKESANPEMSKKNLQNLIENSYQPTVIQSLMIMLANKDIPKRLSRWLGVVLSERLVADGGLIATLRAILDITGTSRDTPHYWGLVSDVLAKILTTPKHTSVYPQLFALLKAQDSEYKQVTVMSVKLLSESRPSDCEKYFIGPILAPVLGVSSEAELSQSLETIHTCCGVKAPWSAPPSIIAPAFSHIIRLHSKTKSTVSYLKSKISDLAWAILSDSRTNLENVIANAVFQPLPFRYSMGSEGGVYSTDETDDIEPENVANSILELFMSHGNATEKLSLFKVLIKYIVNDKSLDKQLIYSKLLSELCSDLDVQNYLSKDPLCIIPFIQCLLENPESFGSETVCLGLMVLGVFIDTPVSKNTVNWSELTPLVESLKNFKSTSIEANALANEMYEIILTRGVASKKSKENVETVKSSLKDALEEAVDPLLPVRKHGISELGKLLLARDKEALKKKETIFIIFKENLKDEDSYIYLSSTEGLAALSSSFPDEVIEILIEEYKSESHAVEDRLKVGEVLLKVIRLLNDMAIVYKTELITCCLIVSQSPDPFMRTSALSNLGEICKILSFKVSSFIVEILECVRSIYETDKHPEPRRAAVMVLTLLLKGLGKDALSTLELVLLELYRSLKKVYEYDKDDQTRLHAQLALEELRESTLLYLNPVRTLEKRIFVLDPPTM